jgi:hypothetical protein
MYVDVHHTAIGDGHSVGYGVIPKISFIICHEKQVPKCVCGGEEGGKWRMGVRKTKAE